MLSKKLSDAPGVLDYPLEVDIVDDHIVSALRVHRNCILELFHQKYLVHLVPIPLRGTKIIMGMDWLIHNWDMTNS